MQVCDPFSIKFEQKWMLKKEDYDPLSIKRQEPTINDHHTQRLRWEKGSDKIEKI